MAARHTTASGGPLFAGEFPRKPFTYDDATRLVFGMGARASVGEELLQLGSRQPFVVCSSRFAKTEFFVEVMRSVGGDSRRVFAEVAPHATVHDAHEIMRRFAAWDADGILAIGGGSVFEAAKCAVAGLLEGSLEEAAWRYDASDRTFLIPTPSHRTMPFVTVPTTSGPGSEANQFAGVRDPASGEKVRVRGPKLIPRVAILDPELTASLDPVTTAGTGVNAFAHCAEVLYSTHTDVASQGLALHAARLIFDALPRCLSNGDDLGARGAMQVGSALAGMALNNSYVCLHHALCHPLGVRQGVPHGVANYIMLPHALRFNLSHVSHEMHQLGVALGLVHTRDDPAGAARTTLDGLTSWLAPMPPPSRLRDCGVADPSVLKELAESAAIDACLHYNPRPIHSAAELEEIYRAAW